MLKFQEKTRDLRSTSYHLGWRNLEFCPIDGSLPIVITHVRSVLIGDYYGKPTAALETLNVDAAEAILAAKVGTLKATLIDAVTNASTHRYILEGLEVIALKRKGEAKSFAVAEINFVPTMRPGVESRLIVTSYEDGSTADHA